MKATMLSKKEKISAKKRQRLMKADIQKYLFVSLVVGPPLIVYLVLGLYPNLLSIWYSFLNWDGIGKATYVGLDNYKKMITDDPILLRALYHNLILMIFVPVLTTLISLVLADALVNRCFPEARIYKVLYFFPNILSSVVVALLWSFIYDGNFGILNSVLKIFGINAGNFFWLGDERTALFALILVFVWAGVGFYVIILMNAMLSIPKSFYEYALIEGASNMTRLFKITLPLISGVLRVCFLFMFLGVFKTFDVILVLTGGGPGDATNVISLYIFNIAFAASDYHNYGYASTIGIFLFVVLVSFKLVTDKFFTNDTVEY